MSVNAGHNINQGSLMQNNTTPELFLSNGFRILGLPVNASPRQITRKAQKIAMAEKLGTWEAVQGDNILALKIMPHESIIQAALKKLCEPEMRLLEEVFWFWPMDWQSSDHDDEALSALINNDYQQAVNLWLESEQNSAKSITAVHNLAVLAHALALDIEHAVSNNPSVADKYEEVKDTYWRSAYARWHICLEEEDFWRHLSDRVNQINDPRLKESDIDLICADMPRALLRTSTILALRAAEQGNQEALNYHLNIINESGFDEKIINRALQDAASSYLEQVKITYSSAEKEVSKNPASGLKVARRAVTDTARPFDVVRALLPKKHPGLIAVLDQAAQKILQFQIRYARETNDWKSSADLLKHALDNAGSESTKQTIKNNITVFKDNVQYNTCWFCKVAPSLEKAAAEVKMFGEVTRIPTFGGIRVNWRQVTIKVPRCEKCKDFHASSGHKTVIGAVIGGVLGFGGCTAAILTDSGGGFLYFLLLCGAGAFVGWVIEQAGLSEEEKRIKPENTKNDFPAVQKQIKLGWEFGEKPADTQ